MKDQQQRIKNKLKDLKKRNKRLKKQKQFYSGKKKKHTIKTQIVINKKTKQIVCTDFAEGKRHDFKLFKDSKLPFKLTQTILVDSGYTGILKLFPNALIPKKKSKNNPLTKEDKIKNTEITKQRIIVENVIGDLKKFRIIADKYRCRRKRFGLRFNLIAGIYNFELM